MLNVDAQKPMADAHMSRADCVGFCQVQQAFSVDNQFPDNLSS